MSDNHIKFREGDDYFVQHMKHFHLLFFLMQVFISRLCVFVNRINIVKMNTFELCVCVFFSFRKIYDSDDVAVRII